MRKSLLVVLGLLVLVALMVSSQPGIFNPPPMVAHTRLAYSIDPPRQITVEISDVTFYVNLKKEGQLQLNATLPQPGSPYGIGTVLINICSQWDLQGTYPGATYYQVRPATNLSMTWHNFALHFDVPSLLWGTPIGLGAYIIPAARFGTLPTQSEKYAIVPAPRIELGPAGMAGSVQEPYQVEITFPTVSLEWFSWSQTARFRAGNVVLHNDVGWQWDTADPNSIYIGNLHIDLANGVVSRMNWRDAQPKQPTSLQVIIDDSDPSVVYWEPDLWW